MKIELNGQEFDVPADYVGKLSNDVLKLVEDMYETKIDDALKSMLMVITRALLVKEEFAIRAKHGKEMARKVRPPAKTDPNLWLMKLLLPAIQEMLKNVTVTCETTGQTVTALNVQLPHSGTTGGQVDTDRNVRMWENNSTQVP
jgi:hypothetical protein